MKYVDVKFNCDLHGRLYPPTTMALFPHSYVNPPHTIFGHCIGAYAVFVQLYACFQ